MPPDISVRAARPGDHERIVAVADEWWGRPVAAKLPRLFLDHFAATSLVAERDGALAAFLIGFHSPSAADTAYVHFAAVRPDERGNGIAAELYERFTAAAAAAGRTVVRAVTSPGNARSIAFHSALGFSVSAPVPDYDGPGRDRVVFERRTGPAR
ncbi:GNAT family N-acetyltransferase [Allonocardiopsis opalescens]|uniref:Acetyltransferase (GNAT) family protein n=1 Tax=Allonocardiopsis opalescens TaxID=1144618 RepID=A0A2T0PXE4_9ACTN|nr:GNAT family N-acetyltransferase [Allonocardiopsis opalescens]PRX96201.1 acetyltransferase (GNAT) family protein [Allonocardiopsis opalescens]